MKRGVMGFLFSLFVFGTFWFWFLIVASSIGIIAFLEFDKRIGATVTAAITIAAIISLGNRDVLPWIVANPWHVFGGVMTYFIAAVIWAFIKWKFYIHSVNDFIIESIQRFILLLRKKLDDGQKYPNDKLLTEQQVSDYQKSISSRILVGEAEKAWNEYVDEWESDRRDDIRYGRTIPKPLKKPVTKAEVIAFVEDNKGKIITWMTYWPWSLLWTILNDPIRKLMKQLFLQIKGWLVSMAMSAFGVEQEKLEEKEQGIQYRGGLAPLPENDGLDSGEAT